MHQREGRLAGVSPLLMRRPAEQVQVGHGRSIDDRAAIVLVGGEINAEMEHQTAKDTTEGRHKPMGSRGATMADEFVEARA